MFSYFNVTKVWKHKHLRCSTTEGFKGSCRYLDRFLENQIISPCTSDQLLSGQTCNISHYVTCIETIFHVSYTEHLAGRAELSLGFGFGLLGFFLDS